MTQVLPAESLYAGVDPYKQSATSQTAYKWSFASKRTKAEDAALRTARAEVGVATYGVDSGPSKSSDGRSKRVQGPALPPQGDRILAREAEEEKAAAEREYQRKRDKAEARDRIEDMVGPREVGRERMLEKNESGVRAIVPLEKREMKGWRSMKGPSWAVGIASKPSGCSLPSPAFLR